MSAPRLPRRTLPANLLRLLGAEAYLRSLRLLAHKLARTWRRRKAMAAYRANLAAGLYLSPAPAASDVRLTVAMPVHRVAEEHLRAAIASVRGQTHQGWTLLALDDASPDSHVSRVLGEAAGADARIRVARRSATGGIAVASNELLAMSETVHVAFLDHDDVLHPRALAAVAAFVAREPAVDWLYTDEDKVDERGRASGPIFKPAFSPQYLLALNLVSHLRVVRRAIAERIGGHRLGLDGAQDYDLALRVLEAGGRFALLPGVLYHWRATARSMAVGAAAKPSANAAAARALAEHLGRVAPSLGASVAPALAPASLFRWRPGTTSRAPEVEAVAPPPTGPASDERAWSAVVEAARVSSAAVIAVPSPGLEAGWWRPLAAYLELPGVALAAARWVWGRRVVASGWVAGDDGRWHDPWAGLPAADPGYLNLALVACPRHFPPLAGWVARREDLLRAWEAAPGATGGVRLALGLARLGLEAVVDPAVSVRVGAVGPGGPASRCPAELPPLWREWAEGLGLLP